MSSKPKLPPPKSASSAKPPGSAASSSAAAASASAPNPDARFAALSYDPKYSAGSRKSAGQKKVLVDERFKAMFEDDAFGKGVGGKIDKYGREVTQRSRPEMERYYTLEQDTRHELLSRMARGELPAQGASSGSSGSETSDEDDEQEEGVPTSVIDEAVVELGEASGSRLAILNCDWDKIRAVDLFSILQSFLPATGGVLRSVRIYPSEFGLKRLAEEERDGPKMHSSAAAPQSEAQDSGEEEGHADQQEQPQEQQGEGAGYDPEILRAYEKDRLAYYFGVATFDSIATASAVYDQCDGVEFEHSSVTLDLRFVPDGTDMSTPVRDEATEVPDNYSPLDFVAKSLQSSKVELTWDEPEFDRRKLERWDKDKFSK
jgi:hypothetical protein